MTTMQVFEYFCGELLSVKIVRSKFFELRPEDIKSQSTHDVGACIHHENLTFLLKVREVIAPPTMSSDL